jgi:hypothetical protein
MRKERDGDSAAGNRRRKPALRRRRGGGRARRMRGGPGRRAPGRLDGSRDAVGRAGCADALQLQHRGTGQRAGGAGGGRPGRPDGAERRRDHHPHQDAEHGQGACGPGAARAVRYRPVPPSDGADSAVSAGAGADRGQGGLRSERGRPGEGRRARERAHPGSGCGRHHNGHLPERPVSLRREADSRRKTGRGARHRAFGVAPLARVSPRPPQDGHHGACGPGEPAVRPPRGAAFGS